MTQQATLPEVDLQPGPQTSVMERAFMLQLEFGRFGTTKKAPLGMVSVDADKDLLSLRKRVIKCPEYDAVVAHDREIKKWIENVSVPFPVRHGTYLIPIPMVQTVQETLLRLSEERTALIEAFLLVYPQVTADIEVNLRQMYNGADYPSVSDVRARFKLEWQFMDYGVPGRLKQLNQALFQAEQAKMQAKISEATEVMQQALRESMLGMVEHMVDRLTPSEDGKKKIFKASAVTSFQEFLTTFSNRNLTNDTALDGLVAQAKQLLNGVDADQIRSQDGLRDALATGFSAIKDAMDGMVINRGRKISFVAPTDGDDGDDA